MNALLNFLYSLYLNFADFLLGIGIDDMWTVFYIACSLLVLFALLYILLFCLVFIFGNKYVKVILIIFTCLIVLFAVDVSIHIIQWDNFSANSELDYNNMNYKSVFCDRNNLHLSVARRIGVNRINARAELGSVRDKLVRVTNNDNYQIAYLSHSMPYLIPESKRLLNRIGQNFQDSLDSKGLPKYQIVVTSLFRSIQDVEALRVKGGAFAPHGDSPHAYGTTFDIAINSYCRVGYKSASVHDLTFVLAEVLRDLRLQQKCYVLYEYTGCFHITCRE